MAVDLAGIKEHLRIDTSDEDSYLTDLILVARGYIELATQYSLDTDLYGVSTEQDALLDHMILNLIGVYYKHREAYIDTKEIAVPMGVEYAIKRLKRKSIGEPSE